MTYLPTIPGEIECPNDLVACTFEGQVRQSLQLTNGNVRSHEVVREASVVDGSRIGFKAFLKRP